MKTGESYFPRAKQIIKFATSFLQGDLFDNAIHPVNIASTPMPQF